MTTNGVPHPPIVSRRQWLNERKKLLAHEKELTKQYDRVNAERRRLPMVRIEKNYVFDDPSGRLSLKDLFEGRRQLVIYPSCSIPRGRRDALAAPVMPMPSAISAC